MTTNKHTGLYRIKPWRDEEWSKGDLCRCLTTPFGIYCIYSDGQWFLEYRLANIAGGKEGGTFSAYEACWNDYLERLAPALEEVTLDGFEEIRAFLLRCGNLNEGTAMEKVYHDMADDIARLFGKEGE